MKLAACKTVLAFETAATIHSAGRSRAVRVQCSPLIATVWLAGAREQFTVPWDAVYALAVRIAVTAERAQKAGRR